MKFMNTFNLEELFATIGVGARPCEDCNHTFYPKHPLVRVCDSCADALAVTWREERARFMRKSIAEMRARRGKVEADKAQTGNPMEAFQGVEEPLFKFLSPSEIQAIPHPIEYDKIQYNASNNTVLISLKYDYEVDLDRISTPEHLISWVFHLGAKAWMTARGLRVFIERVCEVKGWGKILQLG